MTTAATATASDEGDSAGRRGAPPAKGLAAVQAVVSTHFFETLWFYDREW